MLTVAIGLSTLVLTACADPVADAKKELEMIQRSGGSKAEICAAKRNIAEAMLKAHDESEYQLARIDADLACNEVALDRLRS